MTTPWIRTHARIGNRWDLLVGNVAFPGYRTATEVLHLEARIRQYAKSMTWDEATARAAEEEKGHRWKPLSRKQPSRTQEKQPSTPASNTEQGLPPPATQPEKPTKQLDLPTSGPPAPDAVPSGSS